MCFLWFHKWSKWNQYKVNVKECTIWQDFDDVDWTSQLRERRHCFLCGKMQDRKIR